MTISITKHATKSGVTVPYTHTRDVTLLLHYRQVQTNHANLRDYGMEEVVWSGNHTDCTKAAHQGLPSPSVSFSSWLSSVASLTVK